MRPRNPKPKKPTPRKPRILHLDDDLTVTSYYRDILCDEEFGYGMIVEIITSPEKFMERIKRDKTWDVVVMDVMMPHSDEWSYFGSGESDDGLLTGALLAKHVRQLLPGVPIVFLTNRPSTDFRHHLEDETIPILPKHDYPPFDFANFLREKILKNGGAK